jgi:hypothetical protein
MGLLYPFHCRSSFQEWSFGCYNTKETDILTENLELRNMSTVLFTVGNVCWGFASSGVIDPYVFETSDLPALSVTSERYLDTLRNFFKPELRHRGIGVSSVRFQQDGATNRTHEHH